VKNEYKVTKQLMLSWAKELHLHGTRNIINFVLLCIILACGVILLMLDPTYWYFAVLFIAVAIFKLFFSRIIACQNRYKLLSKMYGVTEWTRTTEFAESEIILTDHTSVTKVRYEAVQKIKENGNSVIIFLDNNFALRILKDAFTEGSWEECKAKLFSVHK
jgi:hypothetical protein